MKELFTKNFWKDVKTTYEEAQKDAPVEAVRPALEKKEADSQPDAGSQPAPPSTTE